MAATRFIINIFNQKIFIKILNHILKLINNLFPKKRNQILFFSVPDFSDNAKAMFEYLNNNNFDEKYNLIWILTDKNNALKLSKQGIKTCKPRSISGLYQIFRSKYLMVTHNTFGELKAKNQYLINLWHGMPLKSIGFFLKSLPKDEKNKIISMSNSIDMLISTSTITRNAMISCYGIFPQKVHIIGQPRNDKLFSNKSKKNLSDLLKRDISKYKKIVLYTPTHRVSNESKEGKSHDKNLFNFSDFDIELFNNFLDDNQVLFLFKIHPLEEMNFLNKSNEFPQENIMLITTEMLTNNLMDLYDILGAIDILVTDYSSIYFDFLLSNRPIIFLAKDLEEYSKSRGFLMEPYDFWTPGPKVQTFYNFLQELFNSFNYEYYKNEREIVNDLINKYQDSNSSERIFNMIKQLDE